TWSLAASTSSAGSTLNLEPSESLNGLTNLRAQLFGSFLDHHLQFQAGASLPTGKRELTFEELTVEDSLWNPVLGFPLRHYGQGFDMNIGLSWAMPLGSAWVFGLGGSYTINGAYALEAGQPDYEPGDVVNITTGLDASFTSLKLMLDLTGRFFGADGFDGVEVYDEGPQWEGRLQAQLFRRNFTWSTHLQAIWKGENGILSASQPEMPDLSPEGGRTLQLATDGRWGLSHQWAAGITLSWMQFVGYEDESKTGWSAGFGPLVGWSSGKSLSAVLRWAMLTGALDSGNTDLSGNDLSLALSWNL
ncbi:MAG: hypothetical protein KJ831_02320, partial [Candidatus Eisenbacteria bacterium]|nr:hypothetical protein [Candidatus Eisenbacteria bacterium]